MTRALLARLLPLVLVLAVGGFAVRAVTAGDPIVLTATFDDVVDLVPQAHVRAGDVPIGLVTGIELTEDNRALVTMEVERDTGLPSEVTAVLRQTSLLGERFVELRPVPGAGGELTAGRIDQSQDTSDFEDLVATGSDLMAYVAADRLARMVQTGAQAFGSRGSMLGTLITDLETFVGRYESGKGEVVRLLDNADAMLTGLADDADVHAGVLDDLERATTALGEEDDQLFDALEQLNRLSVVGARMLDQHTVQLDRLLPRIANISAELTRIDGALAKMLQWLPGHNLHVANGVLNEMSQVWNDFVLCGVHDEPDNPPNSCDPPNPNESNDPPPEYAPDECDRRHEDCPYGDGTPNRQPVRDGGDGSGDGGGEQADSGPSGTREQAAATAGGDR